MNPFATFAAACGLATALTAQCPPASQVNPPFPVPVSAQTWSIQHFGQPLAAGQIDYIILSLETIAPLPLNALPWLFCNPVGNTPCLYVDLSAVSWFDFGPSPGQNVTVSMHWPNDPSLAGTLFVAQFGTASGFAGCGPVPDQSVMITGILQ